MKNIPVRTTLVMISVAKRLAVTSKTHVPLIGILGTVLLSVSNFGCGSGTGSTPPPPPPIMRRQRKLFAVTLNLAFDADMRELRGIFTSIVAPGGTALASVISLEARKQ